MNTSLLISGLHENALLEEEHARLSQKLDFKILVYILAHCVYVVIPSGITKSQELSRLGYSFNSFVTDECQLQRSGEVQLGEQGEIQLSDLAKEAHKLMECDYLPKVMETSKQLISKFEENAENLPVEASIWTMPISVAKCEHISSSKVTMHPVFFKRKIVAWVNYEREEDTLVHYDFSAEGIFFDIIM